MKLGTDQLKLAENERQDNDGVAYLGNSELYVPAWRDRLACSHLESNKTVCKHSEIWFIIFAGSLFAMNM